MSFLKIITKHMVICPHCEKPAGKTHYIDHLLNQKLPYSFGPWYCNECGKGFHGVLHNTIPEVTITKSDSRESFFHTYDLLKLDLADGKVLYFVLEGRHYDAGNPGEGWEDHVAHAQYYYEEHSCPTNWMEDVAQFYAPGDYDPEDPHGVIQFVDMVLREQARNKEGELLWQDGVEVGEISIPQTWPRVGPKGDVIEAEAPSLKLAMNDTINLYDPPRKIYSFSGVKVYTTYRTFVLNPKMAYIQPTRFGWLSQSL